MQILIAILLTPFAALAAAPIFMTRRRRERVRAYRAASASPSWFPAADETTASVERFRQALWRYELVNFVCDRWADEPLVSRDRPKPQPRL